MRINPSGEISYRVRLSERHLSEAEEAYRRRDFRGTVLSSQLAVENSAKAVIAFFRVPSWSHDPSHELRELLEEIPEEVRGLAEELSELSSTLAPEHGRATYGEPERSLTPWEIYGEEEAREALEYARRSLENALAILGGLGIH